MCDGLFLIPKTLAHFGEQGAWMYQNSMGFSGFLKNSGTLWRMRLLGVPEFYRVLWIFEKLWYTWVSETLGCTRVLQVSLDFQNNLVHFGG